MKNYKDIVTNLLDVPMPYGMVEMWTDEDDQRWVRTGPDEWTRYMPKDEIVLKCVSDAVNHINRKE